MFMGEMPNTGFPCPEVDRLFATGTDQQIIPTPLPQALHIRLVIDTNHIHPGLLVYRSEHNWKPLPHYFYKVV